MRKRRVLTCLILLNIAFIWGNSAMNGVESEQVSGGLLEWLSGVLPFLATETGHHILRKIAHFSEFACLGLLCAGRMRLSGAVKPWLAGFGLAVACIDETIQIYVPGRASSLIDVWIDTSGFVTGLILLTVGYHVWKHHFWRKQQ